MPREDKRIFLAVGLPPDLQKSIYSIGQECFGENKNIKLVPPDNIHITLKFLGDVEVDRLIEINRIIDQSIKGKDCFLITMSNFIGAFPNAIKANVLFIGLKKGTEQLKNLFKVLEAGFQNAGFKKENKEYVAHATLARTRQTMNIAASIKNIVLPDYPAFKCDRIILMESRLNPEGAKYTKLKEFFL